MKTPRLRQKIVLISLLSACPGADRALAQAAAPAPAVQVTMAYPVEAISPFLVRHLDELLAPLSSNFTAAVSFNIDLVKVPLSTRSDLTGLKAGLADAAAGAPGGAQPLFRSAQAICDQIDSLMNERDQRIVALVGTRSTGAQAAVTNGKRVTGGAAMQEEGPPNAAGNAMEQDWLQWGSETRDRINYQLDQLRALEAQFKRQHPEIAVAVPAKAAAKSGDDADGALARKIMAAIADIRKTHQEFVNKHAGLKSNLASLEEVAQAVVNAGAGVPADKSQAMRGALGDTIKLAKEIAARPGEKAKANAEAIAKELNAVQ